MARIHQCGLAIARRTLVAAVCSWLFQTTPLWAQSEAVLRGQVMAAQDRTPVPASVVTLKSVSGGDTQRTTADPEGWFAFNDVRPGELRAVGYA